MTAAVVTIADLRAQRERRAVSAPGLSPGTAAPAAIVARLVTAREVADGLRGVVVVSLGGHVARGRVFLAQRDRFGQVRLALEGGECFVLRPGAVLALIVPRRDRKVGR